MERWIVLEMVAAVLVGGCGPATMDDELGYRQKAVSAFQVGHLDEAKELLDRALYTSPADPMALYYLGRIACEEGEWEEAIYRFQCCLGADPGHGDAREWLIRAERAAGVVGPKLRFIPLPPARRTTNRPVGQSR